MKIFRAICFLSVLLLLPVFGPVILLLWWWLSRPPRQEPPQQIPIPVEQVEPEREPTAVEQETAPEEKETVLVKTEEPVEESPQPKAPEPAAFEPAAPGPVIEEPASAKAEKKEAAPVEPDDLTRIEGVGPKISQVLYAAGITTFAQVAANDVETLRQVVKEGGVRIAYPDTWPEQAALAAEGDWQGLKALQSTLKGGRRI